MTTRKKQLCENTHTPKPGAEKPAAAKKARKAIPEKPHADKQAWAQFPVVGIGASAGGLEAFEAFFSAMPDNSGMAFILIAHLDPSHASLLPELIQRKTRMKVCQAASNMIVEPDRIYIIPPNKEMIIVEGALQLLPMPRPRGLNLPINTFFHALAEERGKNAIGIILSGAGTDGTAGIRAIKDKSGIIMVQDEKSARYESMPMSAVATGLVDFVLPPEEMPQQLLSLARPARQESLKSGIEINEQVLSALQKIFVMLRAGSRHDFSMYKKNTICRRIERRMQVHKINSIDDYVRLLQGNEQEANVLFKELLIGVTSFFRDPASFESLKTPHLYDLIKNKPENSPLKIWVPGCSSGEEAYSIAIVVQECMQAIGRHCNVQIFGTDIDEDAINTARTGQYPETIVADVSPERLRKFFIKDESKYQIKRSIREMVVFAPQNIIKDPPFTKLDMLCCRNVLIYFGAELQKKLLPMFHYSLKPNGLLFLGSSETIGQFTDFFSTLDKKWRIFKRLPATTLPHPELFFSLPVPKEQLSVKNVDEPLNTVKEINSLRLLKMILAQSGLPATVVINDQANIVYIHGKTGRFLEPAEGATSINIIDMARAGLKASLSKALHKAANSRQEVVFNGLRIKESDDSVVINLIVRPLTDFHNRNDSLTMVTFEEVAQAPEATTVAVAQQKRSRKNSEVQELENELHFTRENLQATIEELETSNEELTSNNEELQSTNEELQSTNEELETSKEELHSTNEELITVNAELRSRIDELVKANDDIRNLLNATNIATIFLDVEHNIRRFTPKTAEILPATTADIGRPIKDLATNLKNIDIQQHAQAVLQHLTILEEIVEGTAGQTFRMRVSPYRTMNNVIDGTVITFEDITKIKKIESELIKLFPGNEKKLLLLAKVFLDNTDPIFITDLDDKIIEVNDRAIATFGWSREELVGKSANLLMPAEAGAEAANLREKCKKNGKSLCNASGFCMHKSGRKIPVFLTCSLLLDSNGEQSAIATIIKEV